MAKDPKTSEASQEQPQVLLVEDHPMMAAAVVRVIEANSEFTVRHFDRAEHAIATFRQGMYVAGLIDLALPDKPGHWVIRRIREVDTEVPLCVLSASIDDVTDALDAGANGYLSKMVGPELVDFLRKLIRGEQVFDPSVSDALINSLLPERNKPRQALNKREMTVLSLLAEGESADGIARTLMVSPHTVRDSMRTLYPKLGVADKAAAVAEGFRRGLLT